MREFDKKNKSLQKPQKMILEDGVEGTCVFP
jgi:hypothetical protein